MMQEYIEKIEGGRYAAGTRISLDSIVAEAHQQEADAYLEEGRAICESMRAE